MVHTSVSRSPRAACILAAVQRREITSRREITEETARRGGGGGGDGGRTVEGREGRAGGEERAEVVGRAVSAVVAMEMVPGGGRSPPTVYIARWRRR